MFIIIVVLSNILIGQISFQYSAAQAEASIQNDIDRAKLITGLDRSILTSVSNIFFCVLSFLRHQAEMFFSFPYNHYASPSFVIL